MEEKKLLIDYAMRVIALLGMYREVEISYRILMAEIHTIGFGHKRRFFLIVL